MELLTKAQKQRIPDLYSQEEVKDPMVYLIIRCSSAIWLVTEYSEDEELAFGWCDIYGDGSCGELGYISLKEIDELKDSYTVNIKEVEKPLSEMKKEVYR